MCPRLALCKRCPQRLPQPNVSKVDVLCSVRNYWATHTQNAEHQIVGVGIVSEVGDRTPRTWVQGKFFFLLIGDAQGNHRASTRPHA